MGLRRGFIQAGAQNLLMTLWPISDEVTVQIMSDFYEAAHKSGNAPEALAEVQRNWLVKLRTEKGLAQAVNAWRKMSDRRKEGLPMIARTLHLKLTGTMLLVLVLDAAGYLLAVSHVAGKEPGLIVALEDIFVVVALLTISVGLILPGTIAQSAVEVSKAAEHLVKGTLADFTRAMRALAAGDLEAAKAHFAFAPVIDLIRVPVRTERRSKAGSTN